MLNRTLPFALLLTVACASGPGLISKPPQPLPERMSAHQAQQLYEARKLILKDGQVKRQDGAVSRREWSSLKLEYKQAKDAYYDRQFARRAVLGSGATILGLGALGLYITNMVNNAEASTYDFYTGTGGGDPDVQRGRAIGGLVSLGVGVLGAGISGLIYLLMDSEEEVFTRTYNTALSANLNGRTAPLTASAP